MNFLVVGIGASAGGLPALVTFFENMPSACDMAFVVVLHLSPTHESTSDAVLQRVTKMPVLQVTQRTKLEKNHVYVIAPNKSLVMDDGHLDVDVLRRQVGQHIAVDLFFRTLAQAHQARAVAIILSGTGADGAVGLARIKEQGGITIAQEPDDAQHSGIPVASIRTGSVDFILPVAEMPQKLMQIWHNVGSIVLPELPYRTTEDKINGAVLTFFDITRRREAEEKIRVSDERLHLVAESTKDYAIMTLDMDGNFTSWNTGAVRLFGYTEQEVLGRSGDIIFTEEDRKRGAPEDEKRRASQEGRSEDERWHLRKDGSQLYCSGVMTTISDGAFHGYAKIARDQTVRIGEQQAQVQAFAKEQAEREHVETASATKDEFLAVMSHELRHPLNLIHLNAELLLRFPETRRSPASMKAVSVIRNAVLSQAKLIEDLLDMSRLNTGKLTLALDVINLSSVVSSLVDAARDDPAATDLEFRMVGIEQTLAVKADLVCIEQVVLNLLGNAIKFTPSGSVTVQLNREDEWARLDVIDTGQGIPPEVLGRVFDMYGQGSSAPSRSTSGLGIGLALVRQIIELHGGRVAAFSNGIGNGAKFSIWLPLCHETSGKGPDEPDVLANCLSGRRVLLVDDSVDVIASFKILLEMSGATVHVATDGHAALALLRAETIDILISDISMPDMDGYRFIREVRAMERYGRLPAIALSGLDREIDVERGKGAGFNVYLVKPIPIAQLIGAIQTLAANQQLNS